MNDYELYMKEKKAIKEFEESLPDECKKCTLLERDYLHKTAKCLYRYKNRCMLKDKEG